jgi:DNA-binding HxlR family transcriptional regulator
MVVKNKSMVVNAQRSGYDVAMATRRSYGDACGIARALDVVGERWAVLVVRELLFGPQRFSDLHSALPGASSNLIADRLHELDDRGVVRRRKLPPPANSWVYELTEWGRELEPIVLALGGWGIRAPLPPAPRTLSAVSALLYLRGVAHPDPEEPPTVCRLQLDERVWTIEGIAGEVRVQSGEPTGADVSVHTDPETLVALLEDSNALDGAVSDGSVVVTGDTLALRRLLRTATSASPAGV